MTGVIDIMNYAPLVAPGLSGTEYQFEEFQTMVRTTLRPLLRDGIVTTQWGREVDVADPPTEADPTLDIDGALAELDRTGCEAAVLACLKMWSYRSRHRLIMDMPEEVVAEAVQKGGGRFIGTAGYNPFRIDDSLRRIETFVRDHGFRYVYFHPMTFGIAPNDRRCYPLYAKCVELGIPVSLQVGHSAEPLPSNIGHPMLVDDVAIDFPDLKINLSHTGWPWTGEYIFMLWRHPNVYGEGSLPSAEPIGHTHLPLSMRTSSGSIGRSLASWPDSRALARLSKGFVCERRLVRPSGPVYYLQTAVVSGPLPRPRRRSRRASQGLAGDPCACSRPRGILMTLYMYQASYTAKSMAAQLTEPHDPVEAIRPALEDLGATIVVAGFPFGEYDVLVVYEAPDDVTAASVAMAVAAAGEVRSAKTTRLLSGQEWLESLRKRRIVSTRKARQPHDRQRESPEPL